jgi:hypothetical protein
LVIVTQKHYGRTERLHAIIHNNTTTNPAREEHLNHEISVASVIAFPSQYNQNNPHIIATICGATTVLLVEVRG